MFGLGPIELVVIGAIAVMLYGKRLPEVGKSVGQTVGDLRRQFSSLQREIDISSHLDPRGSPSRRSGRRSDDLLDLGDDRSAPRFDPPPAE